MQATPYIGQVFIDAFNFAPLNFAMCDGSLLAISQNDALFNLIGTTFGGDGQSTFALPDLRGRMPVHQGPGFVIGQLGGVETVTLTAQQIPSHAHALAAQAQGAAATSPAGALLACPRDPAYAPLVAGAAVAMSSAAVAQSGGSQPHSNLPPYLAMTYVISLFGVYPSQN
jgi:microcystin-dependent protein